MTNTQCLSLGTQIKHLIPELPPLDDDDDLLCCSEDGARRTASVMVGRWNGLDGSLRTTLCVCGLAGSSGLGAEDDDVAFATATRPPPKLASVEIGATSGARDPPPWPT